MSLSDEKLTPEELKKSVEQRAKEAEPDDEELQKLLIEGESIGKAFISNTLKTADRSALRGLMCIHAMQNTLVQMTELFLGGVENSE